MKSKSNDGDLSRPTVEVKIPQVKLRLQDLAFLRSLAQPEEVRCHVKEPVKERLRFLDLIARANVPPSDKKVAEATKEREKLTVELRAATDKADWIGAYNAAYQLRNMATRLNPRAEDVLTEKGKVLLRDGEVKVRARKVGCCS